MILLETYPISQRLRPSSEGRRKSILKAAQGFSVRLHTTFRCLESAWDLGGDHVHEQVDHPVAVAPLVVVPAHNLEETLLSLGLASS